MKGRRNSGGFTLVEIMVAIVIGLFLVAGMIQMYAANKQTYRFNEALARIQENGRFAIESMAANLRMAGFWGCAGRDKVTSNLDDTNPGVAGLAGVNGYATIAGQASDKIEMAGAVGTSLPLAATMAGATGAVVVEGTVDANGCGSGNPEIGGICGGDNLLITDCENADVFQVTGITPGTGQASLAHAALSDTDYPNDSNDTLSTVYETDASVFVIREVEYYLEPDDSTQEPTIKIREDGFEQPMVEGVWDMQVGYGEDTDGDGIANRYVDASGVADMNAVVSLRVSLLLRSTEQGLTEQNQVVSFNGANVTCPDRRICQVMTSTFTIRNRTR